MTRTEQETWDALRSIAGWNGYQCVAPMQTADGSWLSVLAIIVGDDIHHWSVRGRTEASLQRKIVKAVRRWVREESE